MRAGELLHLDQLGPEHDAEVRRVREREGDVRVAGTLEQLGHVCGRGRAQLAHPTAELGEPLLGDRGEDGRAILEVMVRRLVADPGATRDLAHAERPEPLIRDERDARAKDLLPEVLLVVHLGHHHRFPQSGPPT